MTPMLFALMLSAGAAPLASPVGALLACDETAALSGDWSALGQALAAGARCDEHRYPSGAELECRTASPFVAYGLAGQEFILRDMHGGRRELRGVFRADAEALRAAAQRHHHGVFEPDGANGWSLQIDAQRSVRVDVREDGAAELACAVAGDAAGDAQRAGADADHGALAGRLAFPVAPLPPMRVCAVPAEGEKGRRVCTRTAAGDWSYLLGGVAPGEYVVLAFALAPNPNRYIMAHASGLSDCAPHQPGCAGAMLQRVYVHAGEVLRGVDALQAFTDLPPAYADDAPP